MRREGRHARVAGACGSRVGGTGKAGEDADAAGEERIVRMVSRGRAFATKSSAERLRFRKETVKASTCTKSLREASRRRRWKIVFFCAHAAQQKRADVAPAVPARLNIVNYSYLVSVRLPTRQYIASLRGNSRPRRWRTPWAGVTRRGVAPDDAMDSRSPPGLDAPGRHLLRHLHRLIVYRCGGSRDRRSPVHGSVCRRRRRQCRTARPWTAF